MKILLRILAAMFTLGLVLASIVVVALLHPAPVINHVASRWLGIDLELGELEYRLADGRLLCHIRNISYRNSTPQLRLEIEDLAFDLGLDTLWQRQFILNQFVLVGARLDVEQRGSTPWWQQFATSDAPEKTPQDDSEPWLVDIHSIQFQRVALVVESPNRHENYDFQLRQFSSGRSLQQERWFQLRGSINDYPMRADGQTLGFRAIVERREPFDINLDLDIGDAVLRAEGRLDPFYRRGNTDVSLELDVASLPRLAASFGLKLPDFDAASVRARLTDRNAQLTLEDIDVNIATGNSRLGIRGTVEQPFQQWHPQLDVSAQIDSMKLFLSRLGVDMPVDFNARVAGHLVRENGFLELRGADGGISFAGFEVAGAHQYGVSSATVRLPRDELKGWGGPFELPLEVIGGTARIGLVLGDEVLFYGLPVERIDMIIRSDGMDLHGGAAYKGAPVVVDFAMDTDWDKLSGRITGAGSRFVVRSDMTLPWLPLDFDVALEDLDLLNHWLRLDFPTATALAASGEVRVGKDNSVSLRDFSATVEDNGEIAVKIPRYDFSGDGGMSLSVAADLASTTTIAPLLDQFVDYISAGRWLHTLEDLSTSAADQAPPGSGFVHSGIGLQLETYPWLVGALHGSVSLQDQDGQLAIENIDLDFQGKELMLVAGGRVAGVRDAPDIDLDFRAQLEAHSLFDLPDVVTLQGGVRTRGNTVYAEQVELSGGESRVQLNATVEDPYGDRPRVVAAINSDYLLLTNFISGRESAQQGSAIDEAEEVAGTSEAEETGQLFSARPWNLESLQKIDALITLNMEQLQFESFALEKLRTSISLYNGELHISPLSVIALDGTMVAAFSRHLQDGASYWRLKLIMDDIDAAGFDSGLATRNQGIFSARVNLDSHGDSPHEFMSNLSGRITEHANDMVLYGVDLDKLAPNFIKETLELINPFKGKEEEEVKTDLECQVGHALFGDGLMAIDRSFLLRTPSSFFVISWFVDFASEEQRVQMIPRLRRGLGVGTAELARTMQVSGSLLEPQLVVDPEGLFMVGAGSAALYVTGGWVVYWAWRQIERNLERPDACEKAAEEYMNANRADLKLPLRKGTLPAPAAQQ